MPHETKGWPNSKAIKSEAVKKKKKKKSEAVRETSTTGRPRKGSIISKHDHSWS